MHGNPSFGVREFRPAVVVGCIAATGTAIILDNDENIYLYTPPDIVDPPLPCATEGVLLIAKRGDILALGKEIHVKQTYRNGSFVMEEDPYSDFDECERIEYDDEESETESWDSELESAEDSPLSG